MSAYSQTRQRKVAIYRAATIPDRQNPALAASTLVQRTLASGGQPLDTATRTFMEPRFGHSFADVQVHSDEQAAESAQAVSALAYTVGNHLVFGAGQYRPGTSSGHQLLAHELTHVVQQRQGPVGGVPLADGIAVSEPGDSYEQAADQMAAQVMSSQPAASSEGADSVTSATMVQRSFLLPALTLQRCGDIPCNCSSEERTAHALTALSPDQQEMAVQRSALPGSTMLWLQRKVVCDPDNPDACWEEPDQEEAVSDQGYTPSDGYAPEDQGYTPSDGYTPEDQGYTPSDGYTPDGGSDAGADYDGGGSGGAPAAASETASQQNRTSWGRSICHGSMWALAGLGCAAVSTACAGATVITIGGMAVPCTIAIPAVCAGGAGAASILSEQVCDRYID